MFPGLEFRHLSFFVAVAEECSFTRAAHRLHVSQPALSQGIKQLEEGLAATLFVRSPAGAGLSAAGIAFLPYARELLQRRDEAARTANAVHHGRDLPFRFGYSPFVERALVGEALTAYSELVPSSNVEQISDGSASLARMVHDRYLDAALITFPVLHSDLSVQIVCKERYLVVMRADDPWAKEPHIPSSAVSQHLRIFAARGQNPLFSEQLERKLHRAGIDVRPANFVSTPTDIQFQVQGGHGWGLIHESFRLDGDLVRKRIEGLSLWIKTAFIFHRNQERPALPLLAYRLTKACQNMADAAALKKPVASVHPHTFGSSHRTA